MTTNSAAPGGAAALTDGFHLAVDALKANDVQTIYGVVTTGVLWRFLKLDGTQAAVDTVEYPIQSPRKVFGILTAMTLGPST